jgi:multiple sugar transport system permease protein
MTATTPHAVGAPDLLTRVDASMRRRGGRRLGTLDIVLGVVLFVFGMLMISPLVWLIVTSFTDTSAAFSSPPQWLPVPFTTENFVSVFEYMPFWQQLANSIVLAAICTAGSLFFSILAAYGFARVEFRGSRVLLVVMLSALMVPAQLVIIRSSS